MTGDIVSCVIGGETIPVYSLASTLDRHSGSGDAAQPAGNHIIVTHSSRGAVGWLVDRIARSRLPADARVTPLPPMVGPPATRWFEGLLRVDDRSLLLLSPEHLDPRAPSPPPDRDDRVSASPPTRTTLPQSGVAARLVVMFSSPALPRCGRHVHRRRKPAGADQCRCAAGACPANVRGAG